MTKQKGKTKQVY